MRQSKLSFMKFTLKRGCLSLQAITHFARLAFCCVDPFWSSQIYSSIVAYILQTCSVAFELATTILLASVLRELTDAKQFFDVMKKIKIAYFIIFLFLFLDFTTSITSGLRVDIGFQTWIENKLK
eukprot:c31042_g1_i1.p1 GENE.c31042_g1_i1~~c31042_g1_i1.p1  ORF type:complete len:125 (-),score=27.63 c31042_g1_i1:172-546(-)